MDLIGKYRTVAFPLSRRAILDSLEAGKRVHRVTALLEFDVTLAREKIRRRKDKGEDLSFTAWLVSVVGKVMADNKAINAYRRGFSKVIEFDDADVCIVVERDLGGLKQPLPYVVRRANEKTPAEVTLEIRAAQAEPLEGGGLVLGDSSLPPWLVKAWLHLPSFIRGLFWRYLRYDGKLAKKLMGTAVITSIGMYGKFPGWPIPIGVHTIDVAVGGSYERPAMVEGEIKPRQFLRVTIMTDHDLVDGAPAARVINDITELIESGWGLD